MKFAFHGASGAAILLSLASGAAPAWGQETAQSPKNAAPDDAGLTEVVVTGSYIRGTPLDAALPVEVYSREALEKQGAPTALEFAKSLTISGPTTGESYYFGGPELTGS